MLINKKRLFRCHFMPLSTILLSPARRICRQIETGITRQLGWQITKTQHQRVPAAVDLRDRTEDPRTARYFDKPIVIEAPVAHARCKRMPRALDHTHPFVRAVLEAVTQIDPRKSMKRTLAQYYACVQPTTHLDCLGIPEPGWSVCPKPPQCVHNTVLPWSDLTDTEKGLTAIVRSGKPVLAPVAEHGNQHVGPVSDEKLELEARKLHSLMESIASRGLYRHNGDDGDILVDVLWASANEWRWMVRQGQHRAAVAAALGYTTVPVRVATVIERDEFTVWPNVTSGLYPPELALQVFDRFFDATPPPVLNPWYAAIGIPHPLPGTRYRCASGDRESDQSADGQSRFRLADSG